MNEDRNYKAFYDGKSIELRAKTMFEAKQKAIAFFKPPKRSEHMVHAVLWDNTDSVNLQLQVS